MAQSSARCLLVCDTASPGCLHSSDDANRATEDWYWHWRGLHMTAHNGVMCDDIALCVCPAEDCGTMYGNLEGTPLASATSASASACCDSCKSTTGCSAWNFCYCDLGCAGQPKGTCVLKSMTNAFYPRCPLQPLLLHICKSTCCAAACSAHLCLRRADQVFRGALKKGSCTGVFCNCWTTCCPGQAVSDPCQASLSQSVWEHASCRNVLHLLHHIDISLQF